MIYYVGYYDIPRDGQYLRSVSPAAVRKMDYVIRALCELGEDVTVVSPAIPSSPTVKSEMRSQVESVGAHCDLVFAPTLPIRNARLQSINARFARLWLKYYLCRHVRKNDVVMLYHVPVLAPAITASLKKVGYKFILELEEIYAKVWKMSKTEQKSEETLISLCNGNAIVVSEALKEKVGFDHALVSYGSYKVYSGPIHRTAPEDGKIRLVFSGGIEKTRGGAFIALDVIRKLPERYSLTISGSIDTNIKNEFIQMIQQINVEKGYQCVKYVGLLPQEQFDELLLNADIALNLQREGEYGGFLFPSKILTYLAYELPVVTTPGESVCKSSLKDILFITSDYKVETIIQTIEAVNFSKQSNYRQTLKEMDAEFKKALRELIR